MDERSQEALEARACAGKVRAAGTFQYPLRELGDTYHARREQESLAKALVMLEEHCARADAGGKT